jgi:hypothetical protein
MVIEIKKDMDDKDPEDIFFNDTATTEIYTILSKEIRDKLKQLNVSKEKKKKIRRELAFLPKTKQIEYLDEFN